MRTYVCNMMPSSALDMAASSAFPGSSTPAAGARFTTIRLPQMPATSAQNIEFSVGYNVQVAFTGIQPQGTFQLCSSNDAIDFVPIAGSSADIGVGLPGSSAFTGSSGVISWNVDRGYYKHVQLQFTPTVASTGTLVRATISGKGWP